MTKIHFSRAGFKGIVGLFCILQLAPLVSADNSSSLREFILKPGDDIHQACEKLAKVDGGKIHLLPGTYVVDKVIRVPSNTIFEGSGSATVIVPTIDIGKSDSRHNRVIRNWDDARGDKNIIIRDLTVDGKHIGVYHKTGIYGICLANTTNCTIENVIVKNCSGEGILVQYGNGRNIVRNCVIIANNHGINVHHRTGEVILYGNRIERNKGMGIFCEKADNVIITNNLCYNNAWWGIVWMGGEPQFGPTYHCVIANNICRANRNAGIFVHGTYCEAGFVTVANNICIENRLEGLWVHRVHDVVVIGNILRNNDKGKLGLPELRITESKRVIVRNNICSSDKITKTISNLSAIDRKTDVKVNDENIFYVRERMERIGSASRRELSVPGDWHEWEAKTKQAEILDPIEDKDNWKVSVENFGKTPLNVNLSLKTDNPYYGKKYLCISIKKPKDNPKGYPDICYSFDLPYNWGDYGYFSLAVRTTFKEGSFRIYIKDVNGKFLMFGYTPNMNFSTFEKNKWKYIVLPFSTPQEASKDFDISMVKSIHITVDVPPDTRGEIDFDRLGLGHSCSLNLTQ